MAAPTTPVSSWPSVAFWQNAIDVITILSNLSVPVAGYYDQTTVIGGTTASTIISALTTQRGLV
jgi:hypothetical protein